MVKKFLIIFIFILTPFFLLAQQGELMRNFYKNWRAGGIGGFSYLAFELKKNFQQATMDMNSQPNMAYSFFITKRFKKQIETGLEFEKSYFSGFKSYSANINWLMYDKQFNNGNYHFIPDPVYYRTHISSFFLNLNYNFLNIYSERYNFLNMNIYLKGGFGISSIGVEMGYKDQSSYEESNLYQPLYEKGQGRHPQMDTYGTVHFGGGLNYYLSNRISFSLEAMFLFVNADYLDGVHNYTVQKLSDGEVVMTRVGVFDTVGQLKLGVSYHFNLHKTKAPLTPSSWYLHEDKFVNDFYIDKTFNRFDNTPKPFISIIEDFFKGKKKDKK